MGVCDCFLVARTLKQLLKGVFRRLVFCTNLELQASGTTKVSGDYTAVCLNLSVHLFTKRIGKDIAGELLLSFN